MKLKVKSIGGLERAAQAPAEEEGAQAQVVAWNLCDALAARGTFTRTKAKTQRNDRHGDKKSITTTVLKTTFPIARYSARTVTPRHHSRRVPGVPRSAKRRFLKRQVTRTLLCLYFSKAFNANCFGFLSNAVTTTWSTMTMDLRSILVVRPTSRIMFRTGLRAMETH